MHWGYWVLLGVLILGFVSIGVDSAMHFDDAPIDGPFQLYNALRRLADGQRFGGSFQYFHGPGIPYLHLLPFYLFGRSFFASELTRELVSTVAAMLVVIAFCRAWAGSWKDGIPMTAVALLTLIPLRVNALIFPINSMLGLRATMPLVVGIHLLLRGSTWRASIERGALLAATIACGIEQGSATIVALVVVESIAGIRRRNVTMLARMATSVLLAPLIFVAFLIAIAPRGFASILRFNFRSLPADQFWFFGGPPNPFIYRWEHLAIFLTRPGWSLLVFGMVGWCLVRFWKRAQQADDRTIIAEAFLSVYAIVSCASMLGTLNIVYFQPAVRVAMLLALFAVRREWIRRKDTLRINDQARRRLPTYALITMLGIPVVGWSGATIAIVRTPLHMLYAHAFLGEPPILKPNWIETETIGKELVAREREALGHTPKIWSTYSSIVESDAGVFHPYFDYIIHALGHDNRVAYAEHFISERPDIVQTLLPTYTKYEEWLETNYWSFYRPLLRDYSIEKLGPWSYFWLRRTTSWNDQPEVIVDTPIPAGTLAISVHVGERRDSLSVFEVTLRYHATSQLQLLPIIGSLPRYLVHVSNAGQHFPLSLSPHETVRVFPIITVGPTDVRLLGDPQALIGRPSLVFDSIRVVRLRIAPENQQWAFDFRRGPPHVFAVDLPDATRR